MDVCARQWERSFFFLFPEKLAQRKEEFTGSWKRKGAGKGKKSRDMKESHSAGGVEGGGASAGVLQCAVVDSGSSEDDIISLLLPQEIRSQQEPRPSTERERRPFQLRCTSTQMNTFIHTHTQ